MFSTCVLCSFNKRELVHRAIATEYDGIKITEKLIRLFKDIGKGLASMTLKKYEHGRIIKYMKLKMQYSMILFFLSFFLS